MSDRSERVKTLSVPRDIHEIAKELQPILDRMGTDAQDQLANLIIAGRLALPIIGADMAQQAAITADNWILQLDAEMKRRGWPHQQDGSETVN